MSREPTSSKQLEKIWDGIWSVRDLGKTIEDIEKNEGRGLTDIYNRTHLPFVEKEIKKTAPKARILEAGCGFGQWVFFIGGMGREAVGIDIAEKADKRLAVYPEFKSTSVKKVTQDVCKRCMDVSIAAVMLAFTFPLFIIFSILIKIDSWGPVFYRQKRIGFGGKRFTFLKFRSMYMNNDDAVHKTFIRDFIHGHNTEGNGETNVFKIEQDQRVTRVGRFLRKTSLDELPQLINVLRGEMSLVGPRPAIPYEVDEYHIWHRRRVMEIKPGITGFWQVYGRSISSFEKMVRMDIQYIKYRNLLLDIILLLKTPLSMFKGAY